MRFDVNAPKPHYLTPESIEKYRSVLRDGNAKSRMTVRLSMCENNARPNKVSVLLFLLRFLNRTCGNSESKQECSSSKADELKVEFSAE